MLIIKLELFLYLRKYINRISNKIIKNFLLPINAKILKSLNSINKLSISEKSKVTGIHVRKKKNEYKMEFTE